MTVKTDAGEWKLTVGPNQAYRLGMPNLVVFRTAPFDYPYPARP